MRQSTHTRFSSMPIVILVAFFGLFLPKTAKAQQEEVMLTFSNPAVGSVYVGCLYDYKSNAVYLPVNELFSLLEINYLPDGKNFTVSGNFISPDNPYVINFLTMQVQLGKTTRQLKPDDFKIGETEYYLSPRIFEEVFGLKFSVNIDQLFLSLETTHRLPVQERKAREMARSRIEEFGIKPLDYPLGYSRKRSVVNGSMLDYSILGDYSKEDKSLSYTFTGGMELLGGDIQGTFNGYNSNNGIHTLNTSGLRWHYGFRDNKFISGITMGQTITTGLQPLSITGLSLTNDPIEPRQMFETYLIDGTTEPNSEVEIYVNDRLAGFKRADELGYYRFNIPITYGTTRTSLHIYTPSGQLIVTDRQLQVPFTFLPKGVVTYNVQAGKVEGFMADSIQEKWVAHANVAMGVTNWLTASAGTQFRDNPSLSNMKKIYYGSLSARIAKQYLLNVDAAPQNYYRLTGSVMYASNLSLNMIYTRFDGTSEFNFRGATDDINANVYIPFRLLGMETGIRFSGDHLILPNSSQTTILSDFSARLGKVNMRFNYRDNFETSQGTTTFGNALLTTALTYTIARTPGVPVYIRGMYLRAQNMYDIRHNQFQQSEMELSHSAFKTGRFNLILGYSHLTKKVNAQLGFTLDLNKVRSTTTLNSSEGGTWVRQSLNGSIGWDMLNNKTVFSNRQQVGRSAASVLLFVDNNNSGQYDEGDQLLPYQGVKLDRSSIMEVGRDSILRLSQLQSYYKYNLSVNRNAIPDPTLVPLKDKFSFIADPNQYKRIEIPFYRGGTIEGAVLIARNGTTTGQGGLRLNLKAVGKEFETVLRTMSDGGFYTMDLAPGKYTIDVDTVQLGFLNVKQVQKLSFEVKAKAEGDYLEGLNIILIPADSVITTGRRSFIESKPVEKNDAKNDGNLDVVKPTKQKEATEQTEEQNSNLKYRLRKRN
ncbi:hypothetical protein [Bacteroides sedimenti]